MTERELLLWHAERYPRAEPTDLLKLVYQAAFGAGHLVSDPAAVLDRLVREMRDAPVTDRLTEPIGGGLLRIYLGDAREAGIAPETIAEGFCRAARRAPEPALLDRMLAALTALAGEGAFAFSEQALRRELALWEAAGRPLLRHSESYRAAYAPAYRLIPEEPCS